MGAGEGGRLKKEKLVCLWHNLFRPVIKKQKKMGEKWDAIIGHPKH